MAPIHTHVLIIALTLIEFSKRGEWDLNPQGPFGPQAFWQAIPVPGLRTTRLCDLRAVNEFESKSNNVIYIL